MFLSERAGRRQALRGAAALAAGALLLAGCTDGGGDGNASAEGAEITVFNGQTGTITENFNPLSPSRLGATLGVLYEPLFYYNLAADVDPEPELATAFEWNEDGTVLTITTREGVKWSDGEPFTAADVAFTFNLVHDTPALNTSGLSATAEAIDDTTVVLTFPETSFMQEPSVLGNQAIVPEHVFSKVSDVTTDINTEPVGTGPFTLESFSPQSYVFAANPTYWGGEPAMKKVRYISLDSADAASAALTAGKVDWMSAFLPGIDQLIGSNPDLSYINTPSLTTSIFTCSNADLGCTGPQTDPAVRQAIYSALDRAQLDKLAGGGVTGVASPTLLLPDRDASWIADSADTKVAQSADTATAAAVLDEAGWVLGSDGIRSKDGQRLSLTIQTVTGWSDFISLNDAMAQQLAEVGIELKPTQLSWNEWNANQTQGNFQLSLDSIGLGASSNPYFTYDKWYRTTNTAQVGESASAGNTARYSNPVVDQAIATAAATADKATQQAQYAIVQKQIITDMPYIPVYVNSMLTQFNTSRATGWPTADDPYAMPAVWKAWDSGIVLKTIQPVG